MAVETSIFVIIISKFIYMKKLILSILTLACTSAVFSQTTNSIDGKWVVELYPNTMHILENGVQYTYYCTSGNCDSLYATFEAGDGNHIPGTHDYSFVNDTLTIDLNAGNFFEAEVSFQCEGNIIEFVNSSQSRWIRVGTNVADCISASIQENLASNTLRIYPNPSNGEFLLSFDSAMRGELFITDMTGKIAYTDSMNDNEVKLNLSHLNAGIYTISIKSEAGLATKKIILE
jgi:hypothetical protein